MTIRLLVIGNYEVDGRDCGRHTSMHMHDAYFFAELLDTCHMYTKRVVAEIGVRHYAFYARRMHG